MSILIDPKILIEIGEYLDMGMKCFYHIPTGEIEYYPDEMLGHAGFDDELWQEAIDKIENNFGEYIRFAAMDTHESFKLMENFVADIADENIRQRFEDAIAYKKPFQNFKQLLNNYSSLRQQWFDCKKEAYKNFVEGQLILYNQTQAHEIDGVE